MLDVGSNIGVWSIVYSTFMKGNIYAFEPQGEIFNCLVKNIRLNQSINIIPYNFALSDKKTNYLMNASYEKNDNFGAFRISSDGSLSIQSEIGDSLNLSNIGFIKMDVEGHELQALKGLCNTICASKPILLIEIHMTQENCNDTFQYIVKLGYKYVLKITHCDYLFFYDL
jgi:FkbM family methyltransferase